MALFDDLIPKPEGGGGLFDDLLPAKATAGQAFGRGVDQMQGMLYGGVEAVGEAMGSEGVAEFGREGRERNVEEAGQYPGRQNFLDIRDAGDAAQFGKEVVAEQAPMFAPSAAGAVAGGLAGSVFGPVGTTIGALLGAAVPSFVMGTGEVQGAIKEKDPDAVAPGFALTGGAAIAALDTLLPGKIGSRVAKSFGLNAAETVAKQVLLRRITSEAGSSAVMEGVTEGLQEVIAEATAAQATGQEIDENWWKNAIEGAAAGGLFGGAVGGVAATAPQGRAKAGGVFDDMIPEGATAAEEIIGAEETAAPKGDRLTAAGVPVPADRERAASPRLTPDDRASPIPNDLIDDGKAVIEQVTSGTAPAPVPRGPSLAVDAKPSEVVSQAPEVFGDLVRPELTAAPSGAVTSEREALPTPGDTPQAPIARPRPSVAEIDTAAQEAATSPLNDRPEPTQAQKEAGNYKVGRAQIGGLDISIENPVGSERKGTDASGKPWSVKMQSHYGYIRGTVGKDKDHIDTFVKPGTAELDDTAPVFVVDQVEPSRGKFDEHKVMMGFASEQEARDAYMANYTADWKGLGDITPATMGEFKSWLKEGNTRQPFAKAKVARGPIERRDLDQDTAVTAAGREVPVRYAVVEASSLIPSQRDEGGTNPDYPKELQPRDRERAVSQNQIHSIAQNLNPRLLDKSPRASDGAPVIAEDGVVESGNGRVLAIRRAYSQGGAEAYRAYLAEQGYPVDGLKQPVLVRVREGALEGKDRAAFTREANERDTMSMSATEQAMADASAMSDDLLSLYRGGDVDHASNRDFVRAFIRDVVNVNDQARMIGADGALSQEAVRRVQAGLLGKAYGDADLVSALVESTDSNIKAIGGALVDMAAEWAQMRAESASGQISPDVDQTAKLMEAVRLVERARKEGQKLVDLVGQRDIFSGKALDPTAEMFLRLMFRNQSSWTMPAGRDKLAAALRYYVTEARKTTAGTDLLGETAPGADRILDLAKDRQYGKEPAQEGLALGSPAAAASGEDVRPRSAERAVEAQSPGNEEGRAKGARTGDQPADEVSPKAARFSLRKGDAAETTKSGRTNWELHQEFKAKGQQVEAKLRAELDRLGLKDVALRLRIINSQFAGRYFRQMIDVMFAAPDVGAVLHHEAIHALRDLNLFTAKEWDILARKSKNDWVGAYDIERRYAGSPEWAQVEEGIAHAFADWAKGSKADGIIARSFKRIRAFLEAFKNALKGAGFKSVDSIFSDVEGGKVGSRPRDLFANPKSAKGEERFELRREPETVADRQQAMQGLISRGQPIDRAFRLPFQLFGGVDAQGQWKPGLYLTKKAEQIITGAKVNPDGRFGWLNGTIENARYGLIDRYGLDPDYVARERKRALDERTIMMQGAEVLKNLSEQNVSVSEAKVLQAILTGESVSDTDMTKLAVPIRQAIDELGQEAVALGLLSPESYERNRGTYLHRVYMKHEADQSGLTKMVGKIMGRSRKKIIGDQFKGRGMFLEVEQGRLPEGAEKVRIVQSEAGRRSFLKTSAAVPEGASDMGLWEVRGKKGGKTILWRDYTKAERGKMGEILDARYTIGKTYMLMAHDLATGRFYRDIAENGAWTSSEQPNTKWVDAAEAKRFWRDPEVAWVKVPDTAIPQSGGKKRWGALAGKWVRSEIWRDLNEIETMSTPGTWRMLLTQWKLNKTARSPVVHMNNVMSNMMFMDLADIRMQDLAAGLRSYIKGDKNFQEAAENGAFGSDMMSQEIRDNVLKPILDDITKSMQDGVENSFMARAKLFGKIADKLWTWAKFADRKMIDAYRAEDEIFRMATYMRRRQLGDSAADAADFARQQFLDYDIHAAWINAARNTVLPFISYTYRAAPLVAKAIATRPWKLPKYFIVAYMLNALAYGWDDEGDEEKERASLRDEEQGYTWLGVPRMLRMPFRNQHGLPVFLDIRRWIPAGDIFDTNQGSSAVAIPAPLQFGGPLMIGAELALNKQGFTGEEITNELTDDWWDKSGKVSDYLWKSWMPSAAWVPNSWYWEKIGNALKGATDAQGRPYGLPEALSSSVGIKMKPQDVESGLYWKGYEMMQIERELRAEARRLGRQRERNLISQKEYEREIQDIVTKLGNLESRAIELERSSK